MLNVYYYLQWKRNGISNAQKKKPARNGFAEKHYKYEFWSEVIAYQLGSALGLNILRYDVACHNYEVGCISPKMTKSDAEQLIEVGRYMTALNPDFLPADTKTRHEYTFQLLVDTLDEFELDSYWPFFLQTMLFDCIIGNTDRHQENWAFIGKSNFLENVMSRIEQEVKTKGFHGLDWLTRNLWGVFFNKDKNELNYVAQGVRLINTSILNTAPIYDSGSSLGRELNEERILQLLSNTQELNKYIDKGPSELYWNKQKISHFEFIRKLSESSYCEQLQEAAAFLKNWDNVFVENLIKDIDNSIPEAFTGYKVPKERKELIVKLLTLRAEKLRNILT